jgi:septal ring factor EnvC (AmiA/AmiB activator)
MDEMERLRGELRSATDQVSQLQQRLDQAEQQLHTYNQRLTLTEQDRAILSGHADGCVRLGDLRPIVRRVFGDAA